MADSIKNEITKSINVVQHIKRRVEAVKDLFKNKEESNGMGELMSLLREYPGNTYVIKECLLLLQFVDIEDIHKTYTLEDIEFFFKEISTEYAYDYDLIIEHGYFLSSIQNKEKEAFQLIADLKQHFENEISAFYAFHR